MAFLESREPLADRSGAARFIAPGRQLAMDRGVLEASVQLPVVQELADHMPQDDYRIIVGLRFQW